MVAMVAKQLQPHLLTLATAAVNDQRMTTSIAEYSKTEAALSDLRARHAKKYEVATADGMAEARKARAEIKKYRTDLEAERKRIKAPALEHCRVIDAEAQRITAELEKLEDPIDRAIKDEENRKEREKEEAAEAKRKRYESALALQSSVREKLFHLMHAPSWQVREWVDKLATLDYPADEYEADVRTAVEQAQREGQSLLQAAITREENEKQMEAQRAELQKLRDKAAADAKAEAERIAQEDRKASEARAAADKAAQQARDKADAEAKAARDAEDKKLQVERDRIAAEQRKADEAAKKKADEKAAAEAQAKLKEIHSVDGRAMLGIFVQKYGPSPEFAAIARTIQDFLAAPAVQKRKAVANG